MKTCIAICLCLFSLSAWSLPCSVERPTLSIYFGNGMFNSMMEARSSLRRLEASSVLYLRDYQLRYNLSYNHNENPVEQLLEVTRQKLLQDGSVILQWLAGVGIAPDWFKEAVYEISANFDNFSYVYDSDLRAQVGDYMRDIENCQKVLLVAHSQGNFYGNEAWRRIYQQQVNGLPLNQFRVMGMVSVATPASSVGAPLFYAGDHERITRYITLREDYVINAVRLFQVNPLSANWTNKTDSPDWKNHSFVSTYLFGSPSGIHLDDYIHKVAHSLETLPFQRVPLESSALASAGYDPAAEILEVEFRDSGAVYRYYDVPESSWKGLVSAESVGQYYNFSIKGVYPSRRVL